MADSPIIYPQGPPGLAHDEPPYSWPMPPPTESAAPRRKLMTVERWAGTIAFAGAVVATFGSLMAWADYEDGVHTTGIDQGNGWVSLVIALVAAGLGGAAWFGAKHVVLRYAYAVTAVAMLGVFFFNRFRVHQASGRSKIGPIELGSGLRLVGFAAFLVTAAALVMLGPLVAARRRSAG